MTHPDVPATGDGESRRVAHHDHPECYALIKNGMARLGCDVTVSTLPPIVPTPYEDLGLSCPHGVRFYAEPTSEQIAQWARDGVR